MKNLQIIIMKERVLDKLMWEVSWEAVQIAACAPEKKEEHWN